jgi:diaminopimelate decarboxylase
LCLVHHGAVSDARGNVVMTRAILSQRPGGLKLQTKRLLIRLARSIAREGEALPIHLWGMQVNAHGRLCYAGREIQELADQHGQTPVQLLDVARLDDNLTAFSGSRAEVFFSFKTQPVPWIIQRLMARGAGAEVISEHELRLALHLGAPPERIIFNGPGKSDAGLRLAIESGVLLININHKEELDRVVRVARDLGCKARVGVRVRGSASWSSQFGCSIANGEAMAVIGRALAAPELEVVGLHAHNGHHLYTQTDVELFVREVLEFTDELFARHGFTPQILDLGGSLGVPTVRPLSALGQRLTQTLLTPLSAPSLRGRLCPEDYVRRLVALVDDHFRARDRPLPRIALEPGRALTGNSQILVTRVMTTRETGEGFTYAVLDAGINIASILRDELHQIYRVTDFYQKAESTRLYRLVGPICQPGDVTVNCMRLPVLSEGDTLAIMDSGAYFEPDSTSFSFGRPATVAIERGQTRTIRRSETFADMLHRDSY